MAVKSLGKLTLDLVAKIGGFTGPMDKASRHTKTRMNDIRKDVLRAGKLIAVGVTAVGTAVAAMVRQSIKAADEARKTAQAVGITTEALTGLTWAAGQSGVQMGSLTSAMTRLNATLGEAAIGTKQQEGIFKALGIEIRNVEGQMKSADVVLSEIADRFADMPDGVDKSAAAIKIFGRSGAALIPLLNQGSAGIKKLTDEAKALGLVISDEQARQSEQFNDTIAVLGAVSRGTANQIAGELLPTLQDFADLLVEITTEGTLAAGVVDVMSWSFKRIATTAIGAAAAFHLVGKSIAGVAAIGAAADVKWHDLLLGPLAGPKITARILKNLKDVKDQTGIVIDDIEATIVRYGAVLDKIMKAGAGDSDEGRERIKRMADMLKKLREELAKARGEAKKLTDAIANQIEALQLEALTLGMSRKEAILYKMAKDGATESQRIAAQIALEAVEAFEEQQKAEREAMEARETAISDYMSLVSSLRTEEEALTDQLKERLAILEAMQGITDEDRQKTLSRIASAAFTSAPEYAGLDPLIGGAFGELNKINDAEQKLNDWYAKQLKMLDQFRRERADLTEQWDQQEQALLEEHQSKLTEIEKARQMALLSTTKELFGNLADIAKQFAGEQSEAYKILFAIQKSAAIAESLVAIQAAIAKAANAPYPMNLVAMAQVAAATAGIISNIMAVGMAHDGIQSVPKSGTWLLEKGERVITEKTSEKLDKTLEDLKADKAGREVIITVPIEIQGYGNKSMETDMRNEVELAAERVLRRHMS